MVFFGAGEGLGFGERLPSMMGLGFGERRVSLIGGSKADLIYGCGV
jgi:hypothetical protein